MKSLLAGLSHHGGRTDSLLLIPRRYPLTLSSLCPVSHPHEPHLGSVSARLNWLRAGVLGANDGIVSTAGIVVGVAAATVARGPIMTAGIAGLAAGAVSMACAFSVGALLPLIAILVAPIALRIPITVAAVLLALVITGAVSAGLGGAPKYRAVLRNFVGGGLALAITYLIGHLVGAAIG